MSYPQIIEYYEALQHPAQAFIDPELKLGAVAENNLGLPLVMSGGFALTYAVTTPRRKCAVPCFHREILVAVPGRLFLIGYGQVYGMVP